MLYNFLFFAEIFCFIIDMKEFCSESLYDREKNEHLAFFFRGHVLFCSVLSAMDFSISVKSDFYIN